MIKCLDGSGRTKALALNTRSSSIIAAHFRYSNGMHTLCISCRSENPGNSMATRGRQRRYSSPNVRQDDPQAGYVHAHPLGASLSASNETSVTETAGMLCIDKSSPIQSLQAINSDYQCASVADMGKHVLAI